MQTYANNMQMTWPQKMTESCGLNWAIKPFFKKESNMPLRCLWGRRQFPGSDIYMTLGLVTLRNLCLKFLILYWYIYIGLLIFIITLGSKQSINENFCSLFLIRGSRQKWNDLSTFTQLISNGPVTKHLNRRWAMLNVTQSYPAPQMVNFSSRTIITSYKCGMTSL